MSTSDATTHSGTAPTPSTSTPSSVHTIASPHAIVQSAPVDLQPPVHSAKPGRPKAITGLNPPKQRIELARHPSAVVKLMDLPSKYGATFIRDALARYVVATNQPTLTPAQVEAASAGIFFKFSKVHTFHKVKFWLADPHGIATEGLESRDVIHVRPESKNKHGNVVPGRFDTVLVRNVLRNGTDSDGIHSKRTSTIRQTLKLTVCRRVHCRAGARCVQAPGESFRGSVLACERRSPAPAPCVRRMVHPVY